MLSLTSSRITSWLIYAGAVDIKDRDLYEYAVYSFLFSCIPLLLAICIGAALDMLVEGLLIIVPFMLIRKFSGGFHLKSPIVCFASSLLLLTSSFLLTKYLCSRNYLLEFSFWVGVSAMQIYLFSPIDSEARRLNPSEIAIFKVAARLILLITVVVYIISAVLGIEHYAIPIGMSVILIALLQFPCTIRHVHT